MRKIYILLFCLTVAAGCASIDGPILGDDDTYIQFVGERMGAAPRKAEVELPKGPLSLEDAVRIALKNNIDIKIARRNIEIAGDRIDQARGLFMPKIMGIGKWQKKDSILFPKAFEGFGLPPSAFGSKDTALYNISLIVPIYDFGRSSSMYRQAVLAKELEKANAAKTRQDVILTVKNTYIQLLKLKKIDGVIGKAIEQLGRHEKNANLFLEKGLVDRTAVLTIQVKLAEIEQQKLTVENGIRMTKSALNQILNIDLKFDTRVVDLSEDVEPVTFQEETCKVLALQCRPEMLQLKRQEGLAKAALTGAQAERYPKIYAVGSYNYLDDDSLAKNDFWQAELSMEVPFWSGGIISARIREAKKTIRQVREVRRKLMQGIHLQVRAACLSVEEACSKIKVAKKGLERAKENQRILAKKFQNQLITTTDLLDGEISLATARSNYYQAVYGYIQALAKLEHAVGKKVKELPTQTSGKVKEKNNEEK
jgi:outer membrane protein TolC